MQLVRFKIVGVSSILMNNPASMRGGADIPQRGGKKIPAPYDEAKSKLFIMPNGDQLYIKPDCFREAAIIAAKDIRDPTRKGRQSMVNRFSASVFLCNEHCPLYRSSNNGAPITGDDSEWEIDTRRAIVQKQGVLRSRPKISDWACPLEFEYDEETIEPNLILAVVQQSGKFPGVLDYRVGRKGPFGRFSAEMLNGAEFGIASQPAKMKKGRK